MPENTSFKHKNTAGSFTITPVQTADDLNDIRVLFTAYAASLGIDLGFQDFATELSSLPGKYSPVNQGCLLLARSTTSGAALGCVGLRALAAPAPASVSVPSPSPSASGSNSSGNDSRPHANVAEMKRLYTTPNARGMGLGRALAQAIIADARRLGYAEVRLDTLPSMQAARRVYTGMGFVEVDRYYDTPLEGTVFLGLRLER